MNGILFMKNGKKKSSASLTIPQRAPFGVHLRTLGGAGSREVIGSGFMNKSNQAKDVTDFYSPYHTLVYIIQGKGDYLDHKGNLHPLSAGCYFHRFTFQPHTTIIDPASNWREFFLNVGPHQESSLIAMRLLNPDQPVGQSALRQEWVQTATEISLTLKQCPDEELGMQLVRILDLQQQILSYPKLERPSLDALMIRQACLELSTNMGSSVDIKDMCNQHGWGYERFRKIFRARTGISPHQYRIRKKTELAISMLLADSDLRIAELAETLGYSDIYEFSAQFKQQTGLSPSSYRKHGIV